MNLRLPCDRQDTMRQVWIGKDALKEIENLVQVEGRGRLISADSKMGRGE